MEKWIMSSGTGEWDFGTQGGDEGVWEEQLWIDRRKRGGATDERGSEKAGKRLAKRIWSLGEVTAERGEVQDKEGGGEGRIFAR